MGDLRDRQRPISQEIYSAILQGLERRHDELGPVGGGGNRNTAMFVMSTDHHAEPVLAAGEMISAVFDAIRYVGLGDAWR